LTLGGIKRQREKEKEVASRGSSPAKHSPGVPGSPLMLLGKENDDPKGGSGGGSSSSSSTSPLEVLCPVAKPTLNFLVTWSVGGE